MKFFTSMLLALLLAFTAYRPASAVVIPDAWSGFCEGCDNGNVVIDFDGVNRAYVFNLQYDADLGKWLGHGTVEYNAMGISINDNDAYFMVDLVDSPTNCPRASKIVSSVGVIGSQFVSPYRITTSDFRMDLSQPCAQGRYTLNLDVKSNQFKKENKPTKLKRTISGRLIAQ